MTTREVEHQIIAEAPRRRRLRPDRRGRDLAPDLPAHHSRRAGGGGRRRGADPDLGHRQRYGQELDLAPHPGPGPAADHLPPGGLRPAGGRDGWHLDPRAAVGRERTDPAPAHLPGHRRRPRVAALDRRGSRPQLAVGAGRAEGERREGTHRRRSAVLVRGHGPDRRYRATRLRLHQRGRPVGAAAAARRLGGAHRGDTRTADPGDADAGARTAPRTPPSRTASRSPRSESCTSR